MSFGHCVMLHSLVKQAHHLKFSEQENVGVTYNPVSPFDRAGQEFPGICGFGRALHMADNHFIEFKVIVRDQIIRQNCVLRGYC